MDWLKGPGSKRSLKLKRPKLGRTRELFLRLNRAQLNAWVVGSIKARLKSKARQALEEIWIKLKKAWAHSLLLDQAWSSKKSKPERAQLLTVWTNPAWQFGKSGWQKNRNQFIIATFDFCEKLEHFSAIFWHCFASYERLNTINKRGAEKIFGEKCRKNGKKFVTKWKKNLQLVFFAKVAFRVAAMLVKNSIGLNGTT